MTADSTVRRSRLGLRLGLSAPLVAAAFCLINWAMLNTPDSRADFLFERGFYSWRTGDQAAAIEAFTAAIAANPEHAAAYLQRARIAADQGRYADALSDYDRVLALYPDAVFAYAERAAAHAAVGDYAAAVADYTRALALKPYYADAYYRRGLAYEALGQPQAAAEDYARFLDRYGAEDARTADARARLSALGAEP